MNTGVFEKMIFVFVFLMILKSPLPRQRRNNPVIPIIRKENIFPKKKKNSKYKGLSNVPTEIFLMSKLIHKEP